MPYILISTQIRLECGPTICGDENSDPELMEFLGAKLVTQLGNNFPEYRTQECARKVLNLLEKKGYSVVSMTGIGQTVIWTLHKPGPESRDPEYRCPDAPRAVLNKLEKKGYRVVGMTGIGQTCVWTLYNPETPPDNPAEEKQHGLSRT